MPESALKASPDRLSELVDALEEEIVLGWLQPRERLIEDDIAARFDTKRHVVREAIFALERLGLAERQPNRGAVVRLLDPAEVAQIYDVRIALEAFAAEQIPLPAAPDVIAALQDIQNAHQRAVEAQDPRGAFRANMRFHATLFAACGNPHLTELIRLSAQKVHAARSLTATDADYLQRACAEHWAIIAALEAADRKTLVTLCRNHILPSRDVYIAKAALRRRPDSL
ncbi:MAG: GntR family transcriptional regulator [Rhodobacteraceae bacterium]|jgi:DNA-binding GntR family transcriptional regulator|nr:GntR family transcriptional regulator [Paracoccaceae bacterium]